MTALFLTLFLPLAGALFLLFVNRDKVGLLKNSALGVSLVTFCVSLILFFGFDNNNPEFQFVYEAVWITAFDAGFRIGVDGMSLLMVMLTTFITPIAILSSFDAIQKREKEYYIMVLILQFAMTGVFLAADLFLFYIFWELILIPMYFIIGIWGGKERLYAAVKFFLFTVVGSLFMLVAVVWLGFYAGTELLSTSTGFTTNYFLIKEVGSRIPVDIQEWMFLAFALSFLIKVPLFPLHTWLPDAHTEAPTPGSVILAGVLLKMGTYGLIRFNLEIFPTASMNYASIISTLAVIGIIYGALVAMVQTDIKRLVAYSSVSHLGFVVLGIFSMTAEGLQGGIIQMVNHGLSTGMLFLCVGMLYERRHTRLISEYGGIARVMPNFAVMFAIAMFASVGLPGLNGFIGEFLTLKGAFDSKILGSYWYTIFGATGVIFAAVYLLWMYQRVMFGTIDNPANRNLKDLSTKEWSMLVPIVVFIVWIGLYPATFLNVSDTYTKKLVNKIEILKFNKPAFDLPSIAPAEQDNN
ncbi:MAG: NADH-quinone oxidoreductase subunit M [Candidatus Kapabacteria bacterium]|nr:NADH-quinone oxidoreductase subunit M [Ignavibacteriota bacterium]MCW5884924.1 NADH-quinone oxidoreductase subunit M [Candidatus Kapabacteria bacterium]